MLKAHIANVEQQEENRLREQIITAVTAMNFVRVTGWPEMTVIPIDAEGSLTAAPAADAASGTVLVAREHHLPEVLRLLSSRVVHFGSRTSFSAHSVSPLGTSKRAGPPGCVNTTRLLRDGFILVKLKLC
jgi:hypothetical protein